MPDCRRRDALKSFVWDAQDYRKHSSAQQSWALELISKLDLAGTERLLDLGCGDGRITAEIAALLPQGSALGVDNAADMIRLAQESYPAEKYPNLGFQVGDAAALSFDSQFDVVFSNAALHWVKDHRPVCAGIARSLKPGGRILLQMGGKGNVRDIRIVTDEVRSRPDWALYFSDFSWPYGFYSPEEYAPWLAEAGLDPVRLELFPKTMHYPERSGLEGWMRTTWLPYTQRVPAEKREEFIRIIVDRYLERFPAGEDGIIRVHMMRLEVEAIKPSV